RQHEIKNRAGGAYRNGVPFGGPDQRRSDVPCEQENAYERQGGENGDPEDLSCGETVQQAEQSDRERNEMKITEPYAVEVGLQNDVNELIYGAHRQHRSPS